jgi:DNA helicase-2/ATP-dependent DNA helicase PcrA
MEPSRFLSDLPPELFGAAVAREVRARDAPRGPVIRRHPGALPQEPHIEMDGEAHDPPSRRAATAAAPGEHVVDYEFDQRPEAGLGFVRGDRVVHPSLGEGVVLGSDGSGRDAKVTVRFDAGEKRVLARFLSRGPP